MDKIIKTNSFDEAFTKAVKKAYNPKMLESGWGVPIFRKDNGTVIVGEIVSDNTSFPNLDELYRVPCVIELDSSFYDIIEYTPYDLDIIAKYNHMNIKKLKQTFNEDPFSIYIPFEIVNNTDLIDDWNKEVFQTLIDDGYTFV